MEISNYFANLEIPQFSSFFIIAAYLKIPII